MPRAFVPSLLVHDVGVGYGKKQVLRGVSLSVQPGEIVALVGHNGAGKSTLLKAIFGLLHPWQGEVIFGEESLNCHNARSIAKLGITYVPQGNRVFTELTVRENLEMAGFSIRDSAQFKHDIDRVLSLFPSLRVRLSTRALSLSGGEKQMLALANGLISSPKLMLLDEPSLGLAPQFVKEALNRIRDLNHTIGFSVLIVEQKVREVLRIAHRVCVLRSGSVSFFGKVEALTDELLHQIYL